MHTQGALDNAGICYANSKSPDSAAHYLNLAINLDQDQMNTQFMLGELYCAFGNSDKAITYYDFYFGLQSNKLKNPEPPARRNYIRFLIFKSKGLVDNKPYLLHAKEIALTIQNQTENVQDFLNEIDSMQLTCSVELLSA